MTYVLHDADGYVADVASIKGWYAFRRWAAVRGRPVLKAFLQDGQTEDPAGLAAALDGMFATDAQVESVRQALFSAANKAADVLILSDGVGDAEEA